MPARGQPGRSGPRPLQWSTGPDPQRHACFIAWGRSRAQAHFRGEPWQLLFEEWEAAWGDQWLRRGRHRDNLLLVRPDPELPWSSDNVELVDRPEFNRRQRLRKQALARARQALA